MQLSQLAAFVERVASKIGGLSDRSCHDRTVPSREAERSVFGLGKRTART